MMVNMTPKGQKIFNLNSGRSVINVSEERGFLLMESGLAMQDKSFMRLYALKHGLKPERSIKREKAVKKPKKEKAVEVRKK